MTKSNYNGYKKVMSDAGAPFINAGTAMLAAQAIQFVVATQGFSTYCDMVLENKRIEVRAHLKSTSIPALPHGYHYSHRELTSQMGYDDRTHTAYYIRCVSWFFKYDEK